MASARTGRLRAVAWAQPLEDLLHEVARGDRQAFEEVYGRVSGPVYGLVLKVLRDPAQSEEVAQEVLLQVWRAAPQFQPARGTAMAWIMTLAHRRAVDRVRSEQSATDRLQRLGERDTPVSFDSVAEEVADRLDAEAVRKCLAELSDLQREAVTLAYYGGLTYREVGENLGIPLGTIKTRIRDGLIRLRDCLAVT